MSLPVCEPESDAKIQTFILLEFFFGKYFIKQVYLDFIKQIKNKQIYYKKTA